MTNYEEDLLRRYKATHADEEYLKVLEEIRDMKKRHLKEMQGFLYNGYLIIAFAILFVLGFIGLFVYAYYFNPNAFM